MNFPSAAEFKQNKVEWEQILSSEEVPAEVIYCIWKVGKITTKLDRVIMAVSLVDEAGMSFKAFPTGCLRDDLRDFSWDEEWFIKSLAKKLSPKDPDQSYYHYEIMRH